MNTTRSWLPVGSSWKCFQLHLLLSVSEIFAAQRAKAKYLVGGNLSLKLNISTWRTIVSPFLQYQLKTFSCYFHSGSFCYFCSAAHPLLTPPPLLWLILLPLHLLPFTFLGGKKAKQKMTEFNAELRNWLIKQRRNKNSVCVGGWFGRHKEQIVSANIKVDQPDPTQLSLE